MQVAFAQAPDPPVEVVVYSDFQCPFCRQFSDPIEQLRDKGIPGVQTKLVFKNFPLSFHPDAQLAAQAAQAAKEQGKFWEMHDLLFSNQSAIKRDDLLRYAESLKLDMKRFRKDLDSDATKTIIKADQAEGEKLGVQGTPTFFVDGKLYSGTKPWDQLKQIVVGDRLRTKALKEIAADRMSKGPTDAPVTLEFFADLTSPVSLPAMSVLDQAMRKYPSAVRLQFRNFPLAFHPQAVVAHEAAMDAAVEGHFWDVAQYILDHQDSLREQDLIAYAGKLGLDQNKFAQTMEQRKYTPRVDADVSDGMMRGIRGSPVIFVNERRIDGVPSLETLTQYVESELAAKK
jgi:protein-disulfide isomerase